MSRSWCVGVALLAIAAGCLLPEGTVDPDLDPVTGPPGSLQGGSGGSGGTTSVGPVAGTSGAAGSSTLPSNGGSGGTSSIPPASSTGGTSAGSNSGGSNAALEDPCPPGLTREQACNRYCDLYTTACSGTTLMPDPYDYGNASNCSDLCFDSDWDIGTISQPDSIMCRCQHANFALTRGVNPHCYHSAQKPTMTGGCEVPSP